MLKEELWSRQQTIANIKIIQKRWVIEETILLEEIRQNSTEEPEVVKELEKKDGQSWKENKIIYIDKRIYVPNNQKL